MPDIVGHLYSFSHWVWGPPLLTLLLGTGIYLTLRLGFMQFTRLPLALKLLFSRKVSADEQGAGEHRGDVSSFAALCTALASTIGTGNIVGVATAVKIGGPGALFWMWVAAFFGMATKYAECLLAVKYRRQDEHGQMAGGPMYYLEHGLGSRKLAKLYALFALAVACFGIGTFPQVNAIVEAATISFSIPAWFTSILLTLLVALITLGGIQKIAAAATKIVPLMAIFYVGSCALVLCFNLTDLPATFTLIFKGAFSQEAATGGVVGTTLLVALQSGVARGVFSNEAGLGSAAIAAAAAKTNSCVQQGLISMTGTFFDSIVICTMTGLALIITGAWQGDLAGAQMSSAAFSIGLSPLVGQYVITIGLLFFAFTTILGWNYYGERCVQYLFGVRAIRYYKYFFIVLIAGGGFIQLDLIWMLADIVNGLMAVPNLIGIIALRQVIIAETQSYFSLTRSTLEPTLSDRGDAILG